MSFLRAAILLMLAVVLCPAAGQTPPTKDVYHEEEHRNITLTCLFPVGTDKPPHSLQIDLMKEKPLRTIYWYDSRLEAEPYTDEFYKGRLHCDPSFIRNEPIKCVLIDLRLNDTGTYRFDVVADRKKEKEIYNIKVTASRNQTVEETSQPATRERICLYVGLCIFIVFIAVLAVRCLTNRN